MGHIKKSPYRVGRYGVDIDTFEAIGVDSIRKAISANELIIIDEIGRMEPAQKFLRKLCDNLYAKAKPHSGKC